MPSNLGLYPFTPVGTTAPGFTMTIGDTSSAVALESTSVREWDHPGGRTVRISSQAPGSTDFYVRFANSSTQTVTASNGMLILGGTVEVMSLPRPSLTHIVAISTATGTMDVNVTLGYGQ